MSRAGRLAAALTGALLAVPSAAQWSTTATERGEAETLDAVVRNDDGAEIRIWMSEESRLYAAFRLAPGLVALDARGCPTFQIDDQPPEDLSRERHQCAVEGDRAQVLLAQAQDGKVASPTLLELMNGSRLTVRYRLARAGYGATSFSLRRSKQALTDALGEDVAVLGD